MFCHYSKEDNFCDFLFASQYDKVFQQGGLLLKNRIRVNEMYTSITLGK